MKIFKRKKKKQELLNYKNVSIEKLEERYTELQFELESLKKSNSLKVGVTAMLSMAIMIAVLALTTSLPIWASAILTFVSPAIFVPFLIKSKLKEIEMEYEMDVIDNRIEEAIWEEEVKDRVARITVNPQPITFGSEAFKNLTEELSEDVILPANEHSEAKENVQQEPQDKEISL